MAPELNSKRYEPGDKYRSPFMPDSIRHPVCIWLPAFAGMTCIDLCNCRVDKNVLFLLPNMPDRYLPVNLINLIAAILTEQSKGRLLS